MNSLSEDDHKLLLETLSQQIKESHFNSLRYRSESCYKRTADLQRIYNILSYKYGKI